MEGHARIPRGPERSSTRLTKTRAGPSGGSPAGCQRPGRQRRRGQPPARTAVWRRCQAGSGRVLGAEDTQHTSLSLIREEKRARQRRSHTVLRMRGNLEVQAMIQDSRPRLYPRISLLSYQKKKLNCPLNGNSLCTETSLRWSARTHLQGGVHQPPPAERPLDGQLCRPSSQETPHRRQRAHSKEVLPPPPPHHPAPPLCGHTQGHTHTHTYRRARVYLIICH